MDACKHLIRPNWPYDGDQSALINVWGDRGKFNRMEKKIAKHIVVTAFRSSSELSSILVFAKDHCTAAEYESIHAAVASVAAEISIKLVNPVLSNYPDIGAEIDQEIEEFGRVLRKTP